jgi:hypothetical protein
MHGSSRAPLTVAGALFVVTMSGCGRKATQADCDFIVDRYVEIELRALNVTDPATIAKREEQMRADMKGEMKDCVGKRVTERMLACVKNAKTNEEIDKCTH